MRSSFCLLVMYTAACITSIGTTVAQKPFTIIYNYQPSKDIDDSFYFSIRPPIQTLTRSVKPYAVTDITYLKKLGNYSTICTFDIADTSCVFIEDGFGHEIVAIPNDTLIVGVTKMQKNRGKYMLNDRFFSTWFYTLDYKCKNQYIYSLFDSLSFNLGVLEFDNVSLKNVDYNLKNYFDSTTNRFEQRTRYLNEYCAKYNIPKNIQTFAEMEIRCAFYLALISPMEIASSAYNTFDFSKEYLNSLESISCNWNNDALFFKTRLFSEFEYRYFTAYKPFLKKDRSNKEGYEFDMINTHVANNKIKEFLLPFLVKSYIESGNPVADSMLSIFQNEYGDLSSDKYLDSLSSFKNRQKSLTIDQALKSSITDINGSAKEISDLFKDKSVLIDCWATWCKPCIEQIPYTKIIAEKYKNKLRVVYLSFDRDSIAWKKKASADPDNAFFLSASFRSVFANYFNINSIPRYLLFSKNGTLLNADVPRPAHTDAIDKILERL